MKLLRYSVSNVPPVKNFSTDNLTEVVVFAGPNGVGKTTLLNGLLQIFQSPGNIPGVAITVMATSREETEAWGGRSTLDTGTKDEAELLRRFLQRPHKRGHLRSGVLNFDSTRAFEQIQPYAWSFHFADPFEEQIGWNVSFGSMKNRFQEVVHALVRKIRSQKEEIAKHALSLKKQGIASMSLTEFEDPLARFKDAFSRLLPGKAMIDINEQSQVIQYSQNDQTLDFTRLSSGEREVVTVVFDFLLRSPQDCIIVFDEPELHLHPELSYRLLRTLQDVGERNQFIFCTHSPDIITATLEQSVVFVAPAKADGINQAIRVEDNDGVSEILRTLGQSIGVISLGKRIVLIEGERNSLDKEAYGSIIGSQYPNLVLVPIGGKETIVGFQRAVETVLAQTIWGVDFFMLCDGDSVARGLTTPTQNTGRLRLLSRYHLENYFLEESVWVKVFEHLAMPSSDPLCDPVEIRRTMRLFAKEHAPYAVALKVSNYFRRKVGNVDLMPKGVAGVGIDELCALLEKQRKSEAERLGLALGQGEVERYSREEAERLENALATDHADWKALIPGRPILKRFAASVRQDYGTLKRLYLRAARSVSPDPFAEIKDIFAAFGKT